jgi:hypothetical protein
MANKTLAITSKLTMIVASAAFSMMESLGPCASVFGTRPTALIWVKRFRASARSLAAADITSQPASEHWWAQRGGRIGASLCLRIKLYFDENFP